jgi:molybdenum cofactor biosynthesis enzyme MoaA
MVLTMDQPSLLDSIGEAPPSRTSSIYGYIDRADGSSLIGWVYDPNRPEQRLAVDAYLGEKIIGSAAADHFRPDLLRAEIGDGGYGFACYLHPRELGNNPVDVRLKVRGTDLWLRFQNEENVRLNPAVFLNVIAADIVNNCNLRCPFCLVDYSGVTKTELMTEETFVSLMRLIRSVPEGGFLLSCLHEPTLHPKFNDFIELIPPDCRNKAWFTTNLARPLSEKIFEGWAHSGLHHINVSLDTMNPELFAVLRKFGRYKVFEANLNRMTEVFKSVPGAPKLRYITMAFKSNLEELPRIVEHSHQHWLSSENEIRYTYNVEHITDQFRKEHYLHREDWAGLTARLQQLPYHHVIAYPPEDGYEEMIQMSANYFDLVQIAKPEAKPVFTHPLSLRARPDGTLMVANQESQFGVNIRSLEDPVAFLRQL